jgi:hypothetical protein
MRECLAELKRHTGRASAELHLLPPASIGKTEWHLVVSRKGWGRVGWGGVGRGTGPLPYLTPHPHPTHGIGRGPHVFV